MYDESIMAILREVTQETNEEIAQNYTKNEVLDMLCDYEGIIGFWDIVKDYIFMVFDIDLDEYDA